MNLSHVVDVYVCTTERIMYDPIAHKTQVYAEMAGDREVLLLPRGRLLPGLRRGGIWTVSPQDMKKNTQTPYSKGDICHA